MKCSKCGKEFTTGDICPFCNETVITVVSAAKPDNEGKKKKMEVFFIIAAVVIVAAIVIAVFVAKSKKTQEPAVDTIVEESAGGFLPETEETDFSPVTFTEDVSVTFEGISSTYADALLEHSVQAASTVAVKPEIKTTAAQTAAVQKTTKPQISTTKYLEETTVMTTNPASGSPDAMSVITAFFGGVYYLDGTMISGGEKTPVEIAMNGSDFQVFSEMEDKDIAIMNLDGKTYLLNPDTKKYTEINASIKKMMGISDDTFSFEFNKMKFDASAPESVTQAEYNGQAAVCYTYKNSENHMDFIAVDNEIVQMVMYNSQDEADTVLQIDEFTAGYPSDMLNFKGYSKTNMISFMTSLM